MSAETTAVEITLETCYGDTDLYYSPTNVFPTQKTALVSSESETALEVITRNSVNVESETDVIYIGVRNAMAHRGLDSQYRLRVGYCLHKFRPKIRSTDLEVSSLSAGAVTVRFKLMQASNGDFDDGDESNNGIINNSVTVVGYKLYFSDVTNPFVMYSECGLSAMESCQKCTAQSTDLQSCFVDLGIPKMGKTIVKGLRVNATYFFNVLLKRKVSNVGQTNKAEKFVYSTYIVQSTKVLDFDKNGRIIIIRAQTLPNMRSPLEWPFQSCLF